jgi:LytR cell envelope-related transcriptional attenuator
MVVFAFSLQDHVEKYGAYVGIASFFGLAILSLLYFAQAREVKRLREWAGRAPERAAEVEAMAIQHAEEALRAAEEEEPAAPAPAAAPAAVPAAANGAVKLKPAEVAALAFARAAGVHTPHAPRQHPVPAAALAATPTDVAAAGAAVAAGDAAAAEDLAPTTAEPPAPPDGEDGPAAPEPASATNGHGTGEVPPPPPATPAARRAEPPPPQRLEPLPSPRRNLPPPRRAATPPPREGTSTRAVVITAIAGVLVLGAIAFGLTKVLGGGDEQPAKPPHVASSTPESPAQGTGTPQATATAALTKNTMKVAVYNGTVQPGLAGSIRDQLVSQGYSNVGADTYTPNQQRQASVVMYERGDRAAAQTVAKDLGVSSVQLIDSATQQLTRQSGKQWDVVVIAGADKSQ